MRTIALFTAMRGRSNGATRARPVVTAFLAAVVSLAGANLTWGGPAAAAPHDAGASGRAPVETVTVEAKRKRQEAERAAARFLFAVAVHYLDDSLARWNSPICPLVAGLPREQGEFVLARVSQVIDSAKARLAGERCRPNLYIVMSREPDVLVKEWYDRDRAMFETRDGMGYVNRFLTSPRAVRVWYHTSFVSPEGRDVSPDAGASLLLSAGLDLQMAGIPVNVRGNNTRLLRSAVMGFSAVIVVVDTRQVQELNFGQLADYVAMVGLAQVNPDADVGAMPTVLHLFQHPPDLPPGLSDWDQAFLQSLYTVDQANISQKPTMMRVMVSSIAPADK
jgi:hypothetical protein